VSLVRLGKFSPSQNPYALDPASLTQDASGFWRIDAIWAGRKLGANTASFGTLSYLRPDLDTMPLGTFLGGIDMRYGGDCQFKWNGYTMWTAESVSPAQLRSKQALLDSALKTFPLIPQGLDGWYYKESRR
jgi:hypothetical protein